MIKKLKIFITASLLAMFFGTPAFAGCKWDFSKTADRTPLDVIAVPEDSPEYATTYLSALHLVYSRINTTNCSKSIKQKHQKFLNQIIYTEKIVRKYKNEFFSGVTRADLNEAEKRVRQYQLEYLNAVNSLKIWQ